MFQALRHHWPEYLMEAAGLGIFMISTCMFTALLMHPASPLGRAISDPLWKRVVIGIAMGLTAIALIYSPWGKRSGAHLNPSVTIAFFRLGKIAPGDAFFYIVSQFIGAVAGVSLCADLFRRWISNPNVNYAITIPRGKGAIVALICEFSISFLLVTTVLVTSNNKSLAAFTGVFAGMLVAAYITVEAPLSGMSMNPARTLGSALPAHVWTDWWIYFTAPTAGMLTAATIYTKVKGAHSVICAKLHHGEVERCIFNCGYRTNSGPNAEGSGRRRITKFSLKPDSVLKGFEPKVVQSTQAGGPAKPTERELGRPVWEEKTRAMNLLKQLVMIVIFTVPSLCASESSPISEKKGLTLRGARKVIAAAEAYAKEHNAPGAAIAVVDEGGNLMALERLDGTFSAGSKISIGKARTAVLFQKPTRVFEDLINKGRTTMVALEDFTPLQGGIPIVVNGEIVGGIGVSGASSAQQDEEVAMAGAEAAKQFSADPVTSFQPGVTYFSKEKVDASFSTGSQLYGPDGNYTIITSRRDSPGMIEVHERDSDLIYVIKGSATFITGGTLLDGKKVAENEIRGNHLNGGAAQSLVAGDVIVIPAGSPHWFKEVQSPFLYYTVKVR